MIKIYHEDRKLIRVKVLYNGGIGWTFRWDKSFKAFYGTPEKFTKLLKRLKAKDNFKKPNSYRSLTYSGIVKEIIDGTNTTIWIWEKDLKNI